jgi:hypothetical protein
MITVITRFRVSPPLSGESAKKIFLSTAPRYREAQGLIRKYYMRSEDGCTTGAVYLWKSKADVDRLHTEEWRRFVSEKYGTQPDVSFFETPVIVDNVIGAIWDDSQT